MDRPLHAFTTVNEDRATRYNRLKRRASVLSLALTGMFLCSLLVSGLSVRLAEAVESPAVYVIVLALAHELLTLPLAVYGGLLLERRYGLSAISISDWFLDRLKVFALGLLLSVLAAAVVGWSARTAGELWWVAAASAFSLAGVVLAAVAPLLFLPIFYRFKPLDRPALSARLLALADTQGVPALGVFEWGLGAKTSKANAALVGLGATRRIILADTLLDNYTDDEIEVIVAHELGHHVHRDMMKAIGFESALVFAGALAADLLFRATAARFGIGDVTDPAGLPLLVIGAGAVSLLLAPLANALSRRAERRADLFALNLTKRPHSFMSAMRRLGAQNLAEEHPSRLVQALFHSHPPIPERLAAARALTD
jgi:STE24 endopeptidase